MRQIHLRINFDTHSKIKYQNENILDLVVIVSCRTWKCVLCFCFEGLCQHHPSPEIAVFLQEYITITNTNNVCSSECHSRNKQFDHCLTLPLGGSVPIVIEPLLRAPLGQKQHIFKCNIVFGDAILCWGWTSFIFCWRQIISFIYFWLN